MNDKRIRPERFNWGGASVRMARPEMGHFQWKAALLKMIGPKRFNRGRPVRMASLGMGHFNGKGAPVKMIGPKRFNPGAGGPFS